MSDVALEPSLRIWRAERPVSGDLWTITDETGAVRERNRDPIGWLDRNTPGPFWWFEIRYFDRDRQPPFWQFIRPIPREEWPEAPSSGWVLGED